MGGLTCRWCKTDEHIEISSGPGRQLGPIARKFTNVWLELPEDFEFPYCTKCNHRILTPEVKEAFGRIEEELEKAR